MRSSAASRRIAGVAVLTALALIAFLLEGMLPPMFIPGAKLGLGNIFVTIVLVVYSPVFAVISVIVKCVIGNLIAGSLSTMLYSLAAGLVSIGLSSLLLYGCRRLSLTAVGHAAGDRLSALSGAARRVERSGSRDRDAIAFEPRARDVLSQT